MLTGRRIYAFTFGLVQSGLQLGRLALILSVGFLSIAEVLAKDVRLFTPAGEQVSGYRSQLEAVEPGDHLLFEPGGYRFEVRAHLGAGSMTEVFEVRLIEPHSLAQGPRSPDGVMALRLPKNVGEVDVGSAVGVRGTYAGFMGSYINGHEPLERSGVRVPRLYASVARQFAAVERVHPSYDLKDFMGNFVSLSAAEQREAEQALYRFARSVAGFQEIGDFHAGQVVYDSIRREWILLDFSHQHKVARDFLRSEAYENPFTILKYYFHDRPPEVQMRRDRILREINRIIAEVRTEAALSTQARQKIRCILDRFRSL